jgi:conjugal transfer/type IV secretion protein DotA/TraY
MSNQLNINTKSVLKYALLPGIVPRAKALGASGFGYLAFLFACVYRAARILPPSHPFVNLDNIGKFGLIQVIAAAANHIELNRKNLDKIAIFLVLLSAPILMALQFLLFLLAMGSGQAFASQAGGAGEFRNIFITEQPQVDIAFLMLDYVFGIPAISGGGTFFGSNAFTGAPTPFHQGMHALFNFYNLAILLVGVLIFLYFVVVVVIETAQTGVPFGQRFAKLYAPFRLIIAIGLLVPLYYGFNASQYITLYAAKIGSSFATNGWITYNKNLQNPMGVENASLIGEPRSPSIDEIMYFSSIYHSCRTIYDIYVPKEYGNGRQTGICIKPYVIVDGSAREFATSPSQSCGGGGGGGGAIGYEEAKRLLGKGDMEIVLGELNKDRHKSFAGSVRPYCGKMTISLSYDNPGFYDTVNTEVRASQGATGVRGVEKAYYNSVKLFLQENSTPIGAYGERTAYVEVPGDKNNPCHQSGVLKDGQTCNKGVSEPNAAAFSEQLHKWRTDNQKAIHAAYEEFRNGLNLRLSEEMAKRGWGGAGIWYNQIADLNGSFTSAVYATPSVKTYPEVMQMVQDARKVQNNSDNVCNIFDPALADKNSVKYGADYDAVIAKSLNRAYKYFACKKPNQEVGSVTAGGGGSATAENQSRIRKCAGTTGSANVPMGMGATMKGETNNPLVDTMAIIFGINGLFDIRNASCIQQATGQAAVHPLAQLATVGRALVENAIRSMGLALGASFGGGLLGALGSSFGGALNAASSMLVSIATIGLTAGFVLYYILPFMPFMYFFFAVGGWVKSIFEAMVGAPLWALAHLHIDGDGLPGRAAMGGYFLIFEIFLRPIVTVFGLIGSIAVFGAMASVLNNLFDLVVANATGAIPGESTATAAAGAINSFRRSIIDQFFFTIMYAVLLYIIATSCFKMIDTIPNGIMRWIGSGVQTFNDAKGDPVGSLTQYAAYGGAAMTKQLFGGMQQGVNALGGASGSLIKELNEAGQPPKEGGGQ